MPGAYDARYLLMMLIFSIYAGFMYNDFFSVGIWLFGSRRTSTWDGKMEYFTPTYDGRGEGGDGPYPFGIDTAWHGTQNEQLYINSLKMKLSILFGVVQMVFTCCFFVYMDFTIVYKWVYCGETSIVNPLICMAMHQQDVMPLLDGAAELAHNLTTACVVSVPFMLFPKPIIPLIQNSASKKSASGHEPLQDEEAGGGGGGHGHGHGEEFAFDEVFIHQIIETIEDVLKLEDACHPQEQETTELITRWERMDVVTRIVVPERMLFCEGMGMLEAVYGRVSRDAVLYVVRRYFGSEHG